MIKKTETFSLKDPFAWEFFAWPHFKSDIHKQNRRSHVKLHNILFFYFLKKKKWNETRLERNLVLNNDMRINDMKTKYAFNNDDGKNCTKKNNQQIYLQKK